MLIYFIAYIYFMVYLFPLQRNNIQMALELTSRLKNERSGPVVSISCCLVLGSLWDWATSGGFPTCATRMEEVGYKWDESGIKAGYQW